MNERPSIDEKLSMDEKTSTDERPSMGKRPAGRFKKVWILLLDALFILTGSVIFAASVNVFTAPNNIAPGGMTGLATIINFASGDRFPIGAAIIALNVPVFIWAFLEGGWSFVAKSASATLMSSLAIDLLAPWMTPYRGDKLLIIVFGGLLAGLGIGLILVRGATTGGTDMIATLLGRHFPHLSMGRLLMMIDMAVVAISALAYRNFESPLYAAIVIFITSRVIDAVLYGVNSGTGKMMFIISKKNPEISRRILDEVGRGVTELKARGCYSGQDNGVLLCAVRRQEVHRTYRIVHETDPGAFIIVGEAGEISGEGFREIPGGRVQHSQKKPRRFRKQQGR